MGWKEGLGLGKANQGRTEIIEAEARSNSAGIYSVITSCAYFFLSDNELFNTCVLKVQL
jgi:hypothetical protein